ncbi:C6 zinc finger domain protein [Colletotrichum tofieldiae]|nr:C6 zinc finger domain protein [Colletotrichum tofieldiae]GKT79277.1 C6 zinc finger domain protein [Colletotrichum tofieldiae]
MSLGPQCWRCRKKRLRCDSSRPACRKCLAADVECPGYGDKRPIEWRDPLVLTDNGIVRIRDPEAVKKHPARTSVLGVVCRPPRTAGSEMELKIAVDAMEYCGGLIFLVDNHHVAPDLVPYSTNRSPYQVSPQQVGELAGYLRNALVSIAALHRHVSGEPSLVLKLSAGNDGGPQSVVRSRARSVATAPPEDSELSRLIAAGDFESVHFASQAAALKALGEELRNHRPDGSTDSFDPSILVGILVLLSSQVTYPSAASTCLRLKANSRNQIQFSAYAPWQSHIDGTWGLVQAHGGFEAVARMDLELCRLLQQFAAFDIFGMTTHRLTETSAQTVIQRASSYVSIFQNSDANARNPGQLVPNDLAKILIQINVLRANYTLSATEKSRTEGLSSILDFLGGSPPDNWVAEISIAAAAWLRPSKLSEDQETKDAWRALMAAYHNAVTLYAISSLTRLSGTLTSEAADPQDPALLLEGRKLTAYHALLASLRVLFDQRARRRRHDTVESRKPVASSAGLLHKFVIWPMVIAGTQSTLVYHDEEATRFLCSGMRAVGEELGTVSMIDGARLIEKLHSAKEQCREFPSWDDWFDGAPLFLM